MYRQGDFLFIPEEQEIPSTAQPEKRDGRNRAIVGYGEVTGHHHAIASPKAQIVATPEMRWIIAEEQIEIVHEEHDPIVLNPGKWRIIGQRQYHAGMIQRVVD